MAGNNSVDYISYIYGLFVLFGGIFGYVKSRKLVCNCFLNVANINENEWHALTKGQPQM